MPVVVVTAGRLGDEAAELRALTDLAAVVATELDLQPADVYVCLTPVQVAVLGAAATRPWPVLILYGRARARSTRALAAARRQAALSWDVDPESVWAQWVPTQSGP